ncbi:MAG: hypothetical protein Fur0041_05460 [Bacteroidia bacterium]
MATLPLSPKFIWPARIIIAILTIVGIVGIYRAPADFVKLSPLNLILNAVLLLLFFGGLNKDFLRYSVLVFAGGVAVEIIGVRTGAVFGEYTYGEALGFKVGEVPLIIGLNWWMLTLSSMSISASVSDNIYIRALTGAALMTALDVLIEPMAPQLDFWYWAENMAPLKNYIAWALVSFFFHFTGHSLKVNAENPLAAMIFGAQAVFFIVLNVLNKWY